MHARELPAERRRGSAPAICAEAHGARNRVGKKRGAFCILNDGTIAKLICREEVHSARTWEACRREAMFYQHFSRQRYPFLLEILHCALEEREIGIIMRQYRPPWCGNNGIKRCWSAFFRCSRASIACLFRIFGRRRAPAAGTERSGRSAAWLEIIGERGARVFAGAAASDYAADQRRQPQGLQQQARALPWRFSCGQSAAG